MSGDRLNKIILSNDRILKTLEDATLDKVFRILDASYLQLEKKLRSRWETYAKKPDLLATQRSLLLVQEIKETLSLISPPDSKKLTVELDYLLTSVNAQGETLATELMNAIEQGSATNSGRLPVQQVALAVEQTTDRLKSVGGDFGDRASSVIGMGIAQGWGVGRTATALRATLGVSKANAETEVRTSAIQAANTAAQMTYAANGVSLVIWNSVADKRTCPRCAARNQWVYKMDEVLIPAHHRCRCFQVPWKQSWYDAGLMDTEFISRFRDQVINEVGRDRLDYSASPMERKGGMTKPPSPVWRPS